MAQAYADRFYNSTRWRKLSKMVAQKHFFICDICGKACKRYIVHHKIKLTADNINNPDISLNENNLQLLCIECHTKLHEAQGDIHQHNAGRTIMFDVDGNIAKVIDSNETT